MMVYSDTNVLQSTGTLFSLLDSAKLNFMLGGFSHTKRIIKLPDGTNTAGFLIYFNETY